mmetsp:Transcript_25032/g.29404  ORF Transcript_25032/g.29404 Transcript_25032/m.29404 type:complete len:156 (-) Transcript_25032:16-483(-)
MAMAKAASMKRERRLLMRVIFPFRALVSQDHSVRVIEPRVETFVYELVAGVLTRNHASVRRVVIRGAKHGAAFDADHAVAEQAVRLHLRTVLVRPGLLVDGLRGHSRIRLWCLHLLFVSISAEKLIFGHNISLALLKLFLLAELVFELILHTIAR